MVTRRVISIPSALLTGLIVVCGAYWLVRQRGPVPVPIPTVAITQTPLRPTDSRGDSSLLFRDRAASETGLDYVHAIDTNHPWKMLYLSGFASGGLAIGDIDNDSLPDLFVAGGPGANRLYRQIGPLKFEDITDLADVAATDRWCSGVAMADVNNDGHLDIYVCCYDGPNLLFENLGGGRFRERAADYLLNLTDASMVPAFADYDRDGDLDLYLATYRYENPDGWPTQNPVLGAGPNRRLRSGLEKYYELTNDQFGFGPVGRSDGLLRNNGDGTFSNVSLDAGIVGMGHALSATWWDFDDDGWPDLYVGNDFRDPDRLYHNQQDGTFRDVIVSSIARTTWFSMGSAAADFDNDQRTDFIIADMSATTHFKQKVNMGDMDTNREFLEQAIPRQEMTNALYRNNGIGRFTEVARLAGVASTDWTWAVKAGDWDNDGSVDLFFSNGSAPRVYRCRCSFQRPSNQRQDIVGRLRVTTNDARGRPGILESGRSPVRTCRRRKWHY